MAISTIGILQYPEKNVFEVLKRIKSHLRTISDPTRTLGGHPLNVSATCNVRLEDRFFTVQFWDGQDHRTMFVFFGCDSDYPDYGPIVIFSLGAYGKSVETTEAILRLCADLGKGWIQENDCAENKPRLVHK